MSESEMFARIQRTHEYDETFAEVQYNHYGNRGVVDLVGVDDYGDNPGRSVAVFELKSEYAVGQATGANEIARQFTKQQEYFEQGQDRVNSPPDAVAHHLVFDYTKSNVDHVIQNAALYNSACGKWASVFILLPSGGYARLLDGGFYANVGWAHEIDALGMPDAGVYNSEDSE